jgi:hypothetical protein
MDTTESSAPHAHPSIEDHDDSLEAHYACRVRSLQTMPQGGVLRLGEPVCSVSLQGRKLPN